MRLIKEVSLRHGRHYPLCHNHMSMFGSSGGEILADEGQKNSLRSPTQQLNTPALITFVIQDMSELRIIEISNHAAMLDNLFLGILQTIIRLGKKWQFSVTNI